MGLLIAANADVDVRNKFGNTALMKAASNGHKLGVRSLLAVGADAEAKNEVPPL